MTRFLFAWMLVLSNTAQAQPEIIGRSGVMRFVYMPPDQMKEANLWKAVESICNVRVDRICNISFWTDRALTPKKLPLAPAQSDALAAQRFYNLNTGDHGWLWNCKKSRKAIPDAECIAD